MHRTKIEWADYAWNPVTGCLNQQRCRYCYIDADAKRFSGDVRMNKAATGKYKKEGDLYILDEKFTLETGNVLTMPFRSDTAVVTRSPNSSHRVNSAPPRGCPS